MNKAFLGILTSLVLIALPAQASMQGQVNQSAAILNDFISGSEPTIPAKVLKSAKALVIMKVTRGGLIFTGSSGDGVIIKRLKGGLLSPAWSGPAALSTSGGGFGLQAGGEVIDIVLVLTTDAAVEEFSQETEIKFGGEIKGTAGPDSRKMSEMWTPTAPVYVYSRSDGLFGGLSVKGTVFSPEKDKNLAYYGKAVTTREILSGKVKPPAEAKILLSVLKGK
jgi:SH3 domain-containing YSC84-like protein 1